MKRVKMINEIFWLRSLACLAVTFGHAIKTAGKNFREPSSYDSVLYVLYMIVLFGVPVFVFISEFLLSNKYKDKIPPLFLNKRIKVLLAPYIFMSIIYSFFEVKEWGFKGVVIQIIKNIFLGESVVYFILIILQFYLLHMLIAKYLVLLSPRITLPTALIINLIYLSVFNFVKPPHNPFAHYLWDPGYWMPFMGWIFYFVLGFYCGKYYNTLLIYLEKYKLWVYTLPIISLFIMLIFNKYFLIEQNSKRVDMLLFSTCVIFLIIYITSIIGEPPKVILLINNYSFSIFLLNQFFLYMFLKLLHLSFLNKPFYLIFIFILSLVFSIFVSFLLNKLMFGKYLVGQIMNINKTKIKTEEKNKVFS